MQPTNYKDKKKEIMKKSKKAILILIMIASVLGMQKTFAQDAATKKSLDWWQDAKFGMFIHWGLYSVAAGDWKGKPSRGNEHFMLYEKVPLKEYAKIADDFNPVDFNANQWVKRAKEAGMKYIVFTSKHHDGYAMYDSKASDYNIVKTTKFARDPIKELAEACKKYGLKLGIYYSLGRDWEDPDVPTTWPTKGGRSNTWDYPNEDGKVFSKYFERKVKPQVRELLSQYGPIAIMWFDTPENIITKAESAELRAMIKSIQPECIINNRIGNNEGDYNVFEQAISSTKSTQPWESAITMSGKWSYNRHDNAWKSPELMIRQLVEIVSKGGNLLLNISPTGTGAFLPKTTERLDAIGEWMETNSKAIYGTHPWKINSEEVPVTKIVNAAGKNNLGGETDNDNTSKEIAPAIYYTAKDNNIFLFACSWKDAMVNAKSLVGSKTAIKKVEFMGDDDKVKWSQDEEGLHIDMPKKLKSEVPIYVFKLTLK